MKKLLVVALLLSMVGVPFAWADNWNPGAPGDRVQDGWNPGASGDRVHDNGWTPGLHWLETGFGSFWLFLTGLF